MPGPCDGILVNSPVNVVMQKRESTFSESYMDWIKTATQQQIQEAQAAGVSVILPTDPPIPLSASITNQQYHDFQTALEAGKVIDLNATQVDTIVTKSVDPLIYKAWTDCNEQNGFGVLNYSTIHADGSFTVLVRYAPNSPADLPPKFTDLEVTGATVVNPPAEGSVVPFAGVIIVFADIGPLTVVSLTRPTLSTQRRAPLKGKFPPSRRRFRFWGRSRFIRLCAALPAQQRTRPAKSSLATR